VGVQRNDQAGWGDKAPETEIQAVFGSGHPSKVEIQTLAGSAVVGAGEEIAHARGLGEAFAAIDPSVIESECAPGEKGQRTSHAAVFVFETAAKIASNGTGLIDHLSDEIEQTDHVPPLDPAMVETSESRKLTSWLDVTYVFRRPTRDDFEDTLDAPADCLNVAEGER
jgi:hypothetical protein